MSATCEPLKRSPVFFLRLMGASKKVRISLCLYIQAKLITRKTVFCIGASETLVHFVIYCYCDNPCGSEVNVEQCETNSNRL